MKKEKAKTGILILLIICSFVLSARVWFSRELWPNGYNSFLALGDDFLFSGLFKKGEYSMPIDNLSKPQKIVVTAGENRSVYYNSDPSFDTVHSGIKKCFEAVLSDELYVTRKAVVEESEWYGVMRNDELLDTRSLYIDYSLSFTPTIFGQVLGVENTWLSDPGKVREFILAPLEDETLLFYVRDGSDNNIYKYYISYPEIAELVSTIKNYSANDETSNYSYAFELNLDAAASTPDAPVMQKVVLDSLVLVSPNTSATPVISSKNPLEDKYRADRILEAFDYNNSAITPYEDTKGIKNFVGNYSSLKIYPSGMVEYSAVEDSKGINLFYDSDAKPTLYEALNKAVDFAENVWDAILPGASFDVLVTSDLTEDGGSEYRFTLDYYVEGTPVSVNLSDGTKSAVEIVVKNGMMTKYRHLIRSYERTEKTKENLSMVSALDSIFDSFSQRDTQTSINNIFLSYVENGLDSERETVWCVRAGEDIMFIEE